MANDMEKHVSMSISSIYGKLLQEREEEKQRKKEEKLLAKEKEKQEESIDTVEDRPLTKKEKKEKSLEQWRDVIVNLTGDDLEYVSPKKKKNKYKQWIGEDDDIIGITKDKHKKKKKVNYKKEFEQELNMLKNIVNDQNKWTDNLYKRFQNMVGPATKDAMPLNKTQVELAAAINTSRMNSLSIIKAIGDVKKTVADLEMKRKKMENEGVVDTSQDIGLQGADILSKIMASESRSVSPSYLNDNQQTQLYNTQPQQTMNTNTSTPQVQFESFNPENWEGVDGIDNAIKYENVPKKTVVEYDQSKNTFRYKTLNTDTGEEILDYPNPTYKLRGKDFDTMSVRDEYNNIYELTLKED